METNTSRNINIYRWFANWNKIDNKVHNLLISNHVKYFGFSFFKLPTVHGRTHFFDWVLKNFHCLLWKHKSITKLIIIGATISRLLPLPGAKTNIINWYKCKCLIMWCQYSQCLQEVTSLLCSIHCNNCKNKNQKMDCKICLFFVSLKGWLHFIKLGTIHYGKYC